MKIARITLSDRASNGIYEDLSGPEIERIVQELFDSPLEWQRMVLPDEQTLIEEALRNFADVERCCLILTTGGTGPSLRDVTPKATRNVLDKELPGFGELMRMRSYEKVKTSILSCATAGVRAESLIINLPGRPSSIAECLPLLAPAICEALEHLTGFRPRLRE